MYPKSVSHSWIKTEVCPPDSAVITTASGSILCGEPGFQSVWTSNPVPCDPTVRPRSLPLSDPQLINLLSLFTTLIKDKTKSCFCGVIQAISSFSGPLEDSDRGCTNSVFSSVFNIPSCLLLLSPT